MLDCYEGIVHIKMEIQSVYIHPHAYGTLNWGFLVHAKHFRSIKAKQLWGNLGTCLKWKKKKQNKKTTENKLHKAPPSIILQKPRDENGIGYLRPGFKQDSQ